MESLNPLIWKLIDLLFPPQCAGCNRPGQAFCRQCHTLIQVCPEKVCKICGIHGMNQADQFCQQCYWHPPHYTAVRAWALYTGVMVKVIKKLKYRSNIGLGDYFSGPLTELLDRQSWSIDIVTEVPLAKNRMNDRGYNQAKCLAVPLANYSGLKHTSRIIHKIRPTRPQVGLSYSERQRNVLDSFNAESNRVKGLSVLIVDDVVTTGATINACAKSLLDAGASHVYGISLARAPRLYGE